MGARLTIATRRSRLALWQAEHVKARLESRHPGTAVELLALSTRGDELLEERLDKVGGKGLFVKELEQAMIEGRADLAVHSMKDVPADLPAGFVLAAVLEREDPRDALLCSRTADFAALPQGARIGTSSLRRAAQIAARHPHLQMLTLRGNVETRIAKLDRGEYDAILLAAAGLKRLGLEGRIRRCLSVEESLPSPGQAALGIECLAARADVAALVAPLAHAASAACVRAERAVSRALGGSCTIPLGAYAELAGERLTLRALVAAPDGSRMARAECSGAARDAESLGAEAARLLRAQGAGEILAAIAS
ncbi:MAG: hydroxymethylbilane synthase [Betaproteobacteria bacterium]|nr:hydroxymethylbilane synthase [Betaproteobacteria bacterium]MDH4323939.1 hydroxymethylbilane synthase [Betaproteobacteria bacterium]MDH5210594.1 hydroxymethylbilane synthase [Betaproteobacteria bacterium]